MALASAVVDGLRPSQIITWTRADGTAENLTGATLTGVIFDGSTRVVRAIVGALSVTTAAAGVFTWDYDVADVANAGSHKVQFTASFASGATPAITFADTWEVKQRYVVGA